MEFNQIEKRYANSDFRENMEFRNLPEEEIGMWIQLLTESINSDRVNINNVMIHIKKGMKGITEKDFGLMVTMASQGNLTLPQRPILSSRLLSEMWREYIQVSRGGKVGMQADSGKKNLSQNEKALIHLYYKSIELCNHFDTYKERSNYSGWKTDQGFQLAVKIGLVSLSNEKLIEVFEEERQAFIKAQQHIEGFNQESTAYKQYQDIKDEMFLSQDKSQKIKNDYYREISAKVRDRVVKMSLESFNDSTDNLRKKLLNHINDLCIEKINMKLSDLIQKVNDL